MRVSRERITKYINEIIQCTRKIEDILSDIEDSEERDILALKYLVIEIAEAMANILQHILAKKYGITVKGYIDTVVRAEENKIISRELFLKIKPFFDFRNSLIHRYWKIDDELFLTNVKQGYKDFLRFIDEIEKLID